MDVLDWATPAAIVSGLLAATMSIWMASQAHKASRRVEQAHEASRSTEHLAAYSLRIPRHRQALAVARQTTIKSDNLQKSSPPMGPISAEVMENVREAPHWMIEVLTDLAERVTEDRESKGLPGQAGEYLEAAIEEQRSHVADQLKLHDEMLSRIRAELRADLQEVDPERRQAEQSYAGESRRERTIHDAPDDSL